MFVRFRQQAHRLQISLIESRRVAGKVRHEHVASLGAVDVPPSVPDRVAFWERLHQRLGKLSNRLDAATQGKILGDVHARLPMVTTEELRALQHQNAAGDVKFWEGLRDMQQARADDNKGLAAAIARTIADAEAGARLAGINADAAKDRAACLDRGEVVLGGVGKPPTREDLFRALADGGFTPEDIARIEAVARISALGGFEELLEEIEKLRKRAERAAVRIVLRRRLRLAGLSG